jgi:hypothetical protein
MNVRGLVGAAGVMASLLSAQAAAGQTRSDVPARFSIADMPAPGGARTVCLGRHDRGVRVVGCFDVYELHNGGLFDTNKNVKVRQFVWKYTAEARAVGRSTAVTALTAEVRSDAADTYDWAPGGDLPVTGPTALDSAVTVDLVPDSSGGGKPAVVSAKDGWRYNALSGEIVPYLNAHLHSVTWNAAAKHLPDRGDIPQVAGATLWGIPEPAPTAMPAKLRVEAHHR